MCRQKEFLSPCDRKYTKVMQLSCAFRTEGRQRGMSPTHALLVYRCKVLPTVGLVLPLLFLFYDPTVSPHAAMNSVGS